MSILQKDLPGARVLDLFAGSGALGLEALSRGAVTADFVEKNAASLRSLRANIVFRNKKRIDIDFSNSGLLYDEAAKTYEYALQEIEIR